MAFSGAAVSAEPQPHIALQNAWFTAADVTPYGVENGVIVISGHWFLQEGTNGMDRPAFLRTRQPKVERRLREFLKRYREDNGHPFDRHTDAIIVIDIERPHPKDLWNCGDGPAEDEDLVEPEADPVMCPRKLRREIVRAYVTRINAAREIFPNARLALYGTLNPDPQGRSEAPQFSLRQQALKQAGEWRLYDDLAYLVPVLYVRFGCEDEVDGPCDPRWHTWLARSTKLGLAGSGELERSDGSDPPLLPLLSFWLVNRCKVSLDECGLLINLGVSGVKATLGEQIRILEHADSFVDNPVHEYAFWRGGIDSNALTGTPAEPPSTVTANFCELYRKPWCSSTLVP